MAAAVELEQSGRGPAVLFLHGTPTTWDVLRPIAEAYAGRRLLAAMPGYGKNPGWPGPTTTTAMVESIERAVLGAGVRELSIVGFSGGAYHALHLAVRGVLRVDRIVALGALGDLAADERAGLRATAQALRSGQDLAGVATARFLAPAFARGNPGACARVETWLEATPRDNLAAELEALSEAPLLLERLSTFQGLVLARTGALDGASPPSHARAIAQACPRGVVQIVDGCGHALLEEDLSGTLRAALSVLQ
jgi:pimeloyl-ACP methyl ester carboxylesterase